MNIPYNGKSPSIHESVFVAPGAYLIGDVQVGKDSSIWFNAVLRADNGSVIIGERCSVQENSIFYLDGPDFFIIEDDLKFVHNFILHGSKVGKRTIIGMGS